MILERKISNLKKSFQDAAEMMKFFNVRLLFTNCNPTDLAATKIGFSVQYNCCKPSIAVTVNNDINIFSFLFSPLDG